jgi:ABC-2 type transport system permease protein
MMQRVYRVAQREYLAYVRTRTFLVSALALPFSLLLAVALPILMESVPKPPRVFTVIDETGRYETTVVADLMREGAAQGIPVDSRDYRYVAPRQLDLPPNSVSRLWLLETAVRTGDLFAFFRISSGPASLCQLDYYTADPSAEGLARVVRRVVNRVAVREDLLPVVTDEVLLARVVEGVPLKTHAVTETGAEEAAVAHIARAYAPMAFVYLLWLSVIMMAGHLMTSTIEEKTSHVIEVLLSSVSPFEFMFGKLIGLAAAGMTMILVWVFSGILAFTAVQNPMMHQIGLGIASGFSGATAFWFLGFFVIGFLFFSSLFIGIGSVCNTIRETQNLTQPIMFVLVIPLVLMPFVTNNPDHIIVVLASFFPPFTPFVIMNRIPATPPAPLWQVVLAALLMVVSTWLMIKAAARVFRIGILMYGKPPTLPELLRWARRSG